MAGHCVGLFGCDNRFCGDPECAHHGQPESGGDELVAHWAGHKLRAAGADLPELGGEADGRDGDVRGCGGADTVLHREQPGEVPGAEWGEV